MALFNEILEARYSLLLAKLLSMKGGPPAPQLSGDISAGISLESDSPEWYALMGGRLCVGQGQLGAGGAGNRSQVVLTNPGSSGVICRVELILAASTAAVFGFPFRRNIGVGAFGTSATVSVSDLRIQQTPSCTIRTSNGAGVVGTLMGVMFPDFSAAAVYAGRFEKPFVLGPGQQLGVDPGADNQDLQVTFYWRERAANQSELALGA